MQYVMKCGGLAGRPLTREGQPPPVGAYIKSYDPEARDGMGKVVWTGSLAEALTFPSAAQAFKLWAAVPANRPTRPDGRPNKPLTAFTVSVESKAAQPGGAFAKIRRHSDAN